MTQAQSEFKKGDIVRVWKYYLVSDESEIKEPTYAVIRAVRRPHGGYLDFLVGRPFNDDDDYDFNRSREWPFNSNDVIEVLSEDKVPDEVWTALAVISLTDERSD